MSRIRANQITNKTATGAPTVQNGLVVTGVTTSTSFSGSGANLTNLPAQATIANNADNRVITGGSGVNLNGESNFTYDGTIGAINGNTAGLAVGTNAMVSGRADNALHLHKASSGTADGPTIYFTNQQSGVTGSDGLTIGLNDTLSPYIWNRENTDVRFGTNNAERFRFGSSGQLGIAGANYGTSGQALVSQGASSAPQWASVSSAAGSVYDTFHGQGFSSQSGNGYYTSGWGKPGGPGASWANGPSGKLITESSGIFSFPSTGIYYISHRLQFSGQNINMRIGGNRIYATNTNANPPAHQVAEGQCNINSFSGTSNGYGWAAAFCECIVKITNITNDKVAFWWQSSEASNIGSGVGNMAVFIKIADLN